MQLSRTLNSRFNLESRKYSFDDSERKICFTRTKKLEFERLGCHFTFQMEFHSRTPKKCAEVFFSPCFPQWKTDIRVSLHKYINCYLVQDTLVEKGKTRTQPEQPWCRAFWPRCWIRTSMRRGYLRFHASRKLALRGGITAIERRIFIERREFNGHFAPPFIKENARAFRKLFRLCQCLRSWIIRNELNVFRAAAPSATRYTPPSRPRMIRCHGPGQRVPTLRKRRIAGYLRIPPEFSVISFPLQVLPSTSADFKRSL